MESIIAVGESFDWMKLNLTASAQVLEGPG